MLEEPDFIPEQSKQEFERWKALPPTVRVGMELLMSKYEHSFLAKRIFEFEALAAAGVIQYVKKPSERNIRWFKAHKEGKSHAQIARDAGLDMDPSTGRKTKKQLESGRSTVAKVIQKMEADWREWERAAAEIKAHLGWQ
jgi:hypothetical protein